MSQPNQDQRACDTCRFFVPVVDREHVPFELGECQIDAPELGTEFPFPLRYPGEFCPRYVYDQSRSRVLALDQRRAS